MYLNAKFLEARSLPAADPYPPSTLVVLLAGTETINLIGPQELFAQFDQVEQFAEVLVEVRWRKIDLERLGGSGKGNAYRLKALKLIDPNELVAG